MIGMGLGGVNRVRDRVVSVLFFLRNTTPPPKKKMWKNHLVSRKTNQLKLNHLVRKELTSKIIKLTETKNYITSYDLF